MGGDEQPASGVGATTSAEGEVELHYGTQPCHPASGTMRVRIAGVVRRENETGSAVADAGCKGSRAGRDGRGLTSSRPRLVAVRDDIRRADGLVLPNEMLP